MELHFWNTKNYPVYEDAVKAKAIFICDGPAIEWEVANWGFQGGFLCDTMQAIQCAFKAAGVSTSDIDCVVFDDDGQSMGTWGE